jgi:hypothetical protein
MKYRRAGMKIKTSDLTLLALDWVTVRCECDIPAQFKSIPALLNGTVRVFRGDISSYSGPVSPSTNWAQAGPIIEREGVCLWSEGYDWEAKIQTGPGEWLTEWDASPLVAAMRCYVASKLGDEVDIPEELQ